MERKWWHEKTAYQIYPKSFMDSNHDGIGDLRGIIGKLDYLQELGVEIVWLSPIYCSPQADEGYDISDYYNIDPRFGTMEDLDELIAEAKKRGIGIVMDLVVNHCSDEHEWFQKACEDPDGKYGKYFYIEDYRNGKAPSNLRSCFGGSAWEPLPGHPDKCYLHLFHKKQPDLNWENPEMREEIYQMINWWLDKGLAGFRIDAIINIKKALPFRDYPADRPDGMSSPQKMVDDAKGIGEFFAELKNRCFAPHEAFTAAEIFNAREENLAAYIGDSGYFSTMYDFRANEFGFSEQGWYACQKPSPDDYRDCSFRSQKVSEGIGFYSNIIENHDEPRGVSRYLNEDGINDAGKKGLATAMFMLRGLPFVYQGQEIGMENRTFHSIEEVDDINTHGEYQAAIEAGLSPEKALKAVSLFCRDNGRTPFQWNSSTNAGFTDGTPWIKVNPNYTEINLERQRRDPDSVYQYYRRLIALRKDERFKETIVYGTTEPLFEDRKNLMAFTRASEKQTLLTAINFGSEPQKLSLDKAYRQVVLNNCRTLEASKNAIILEPYQAVVLELE